MSDRPRSDKDTIEAARAASVRARRVFGALADVTGVGITRKGGRYAVKVNLRSLKIPFERLPATIDGVPVVLKLTGSIRGQQRS